MFVPIVTAVLGKKAPPKDDKKKKGQEEEISAEEKERLAREQAQKEAEVQRRKEEWESLNDQDKFFRVNEDPFKEPRIEFQTPEGEENLRCMNEVIVEGLDLLKFDYQVNDDSFCYLYFEIEENKQVIEIK